MPSPRCLYSVVTAFALLAGCLGVTTALAQNDTPGEDRAPVLLRGSRLFTPFETAGSGLAPELKVKVTIDARGAVSKVDVENIRPSSEFDEVFISRTRQTIANWRYAPAVVDGEFSETELTWTIRFEAAEGEWKNRRIDYGAWAPGLLAGPEIQGSLSNRRAEKIFGQLSREDRIAMLGRHAGVAEKALDREHRTQFDSPRFSLVTDVADDTSAGLIAGNLEAVFNILGGLFGEEIPPQPEPYRIVAYVFSKRANYRKVTQELFQESRAEGMYLAPGLILFHVEMQDLEHFQHVLIHETVHAYLDRHLTRRGNRLPLWFNEGFAEYMSGSRIKKGTLIPGKVQESRWALSHYGAYRAKTMPGGLIAYLKRIVRKGEGLSVEELIDSAPQTISEKYQVYYPTSWLFVHFLRHGEESWAENEFPRFFLYLAEGYPAAESFEKVYGRKPSEVDEQFRTYVKKF